MRWAMVLLGAAIAVGDGGATLVGVVVGVGIVWVVGGGGCLRGNSFSGRGVPKRTSLVTNTFCAGGTRLLCQIVHKNKPPPKAKCAKKEAASIGPSLLGSKGEDDISDTRLLGAATRLSPTRRVIHRHIGALGCMGSVTMPTFSTPASLMIAMMSTTKP